MQGKMDVREVVKKSKETIATIFKDENVLEPRLEEITLRQGAWDVTISFRRGLAFAHDRTFKVVHINDHTGDVRSVTHREF